MNTKKISSPVSFSYRAVVGDDVVRYTLISSFCSIIISVVYLSLMAGRMPSEVPLYYSLPWGQERLAETWWLLYIPAGSFLFFMINVLLALITYKSEPVLSRLFSAAAGFVSFLGAYTLIRIILLVT